MTSYDRAMRRFEGGKDRFWEIRRDGATVQTRSGKLGTDGKAMKVDGRGYDHFSGA